MTEKKPSMASRLLAAIDIKGVDTAPPKEPPPPTLNEKLDTARAVLVDAEHRHAEASLGREEGTADAAECEQARKALDAAQRRVADLEGAIEAEGRKKALAKQERAVKAERKRDKAHTAARKRAAVAAVKVDAAIDALAKTTKEALTALDDMRVTRPKGSHVPDLVREAAARLPFVIGFRCRHVQGMKMHPFADDMHAKFARFVPPQQ